METDVRKMLQSFAASTASAAEEALDAVESAKRAMGGKFDEVKLNLTLSRLQARQERLFAEIGRAMFLLRAGTLPETVREGEKTPQQALDSLLVSAEQLQQQVDALKQKLNADKPGLACPACNRACGEADVFCAACGAKLNG